MTEANAAGQGLCRGTLATTVLSLKSMRDPCASGPRRAPLPLGPTTASRSPRCTVKVTSENSTDSPSCVFVMPSTVSSGSLPPPPPPPPEDAPPPRPPLAAALTDLNDGAGLSWLPALPAAPQVQIAPTVRVRSPDEHSCQVYALVFAAAPLCRHLALPQSRQHHSRALHVSLGRGLS